MSRNEMIKNAKAAIPALDVNLSMSVDELNETVRNAMFEHFVSAVASDSTVCGVPAIDSREFAVDFIKNNDYVKNYLTATINLVLNGGFSNKLELTNFVHRLLWKHVVKASHELLSNYKNVNPFCSLNNQPKVNCVLE